MFIGRLQTYVKIVCWSSFSHKAQADPVASGHYDACNDVVSKGNGRRLTQSEQTGPLWRHGIANSSHGGMSDQFFLWQHSATSSMRSPARGDLFRVATTGSSETAERYLPHRQCHRGLLRGSESTSSSWLIMATNSSTPSTHGRRHPPGCASDWHDCPVRLSRCNSVGTN